MAKDVKIEKDANVLPAHTTAENLLALLDAYRRKPGKEDEAKVIFGKGTKLYNSTKAALRAFKLINENDCGFTKLGRNVAFSTDEEKKKVLLRFMSSYFPYESLLANILQKSPVASTESTIIENFWGKFGQGSNQRNLEGASNLFGNMVEYVGLGTYVIGRRGKPTRIEWVSNAADLFNAALAESGAPDEHAEVQVETEEIEENIEVAEPTTEETEEATPSYEQPAVTYEPKPEEKVAPSIITKPFIAPNITINVDMSDWPEEKIKSFFKYAYAKFEEETE